LICLSLGSTTYMILNGHKRFFAAALGDASWKLCALLAILVGMGVMGFDYRALIVGLVVGSVAKLATHVAGMGRHAVRLRPAFNWRSPAMRRLLLLMLPLIVGIVFAKVRDIFNNVTVLSTLEAEGLMKANSLGRKLYTTLGWLVPYAISIAMFPFLCEMVDRKDRVGVGRLLTQSSRMLLAVFVPFSLVCVVLAYPICTVLYYSAANTPLETVRWIAVSTACYTLVFPAFALEFLFMQAFFAHRRMVSITVVGVIFSALSIAVSYVGVVVMGAEGAVGLAVVALGYTLSRALKTTTLVGLLRKNAAILPLRETGPFALRIGIVALVSAGAAYGTICLVNPLLANRAVRTAALLKLGAGGCAAVVTYLLGIWLLKIGEPAEMVRWAYARISGRRKENEA